jgi:hypothetical protein
VFTVQIFSDLDRFFGFCVANSQIQRAGSDLLSDGICGLLSGRPRGRGEFFLTFEFLVPPENNRNVLTENIEKKQNKNIHKKT